MKPIIVGRYFNDAYIGRTIMWSVDRLNYFSSPVAALDYLYFGGLNAK